MITTASGDGACQDASFRTVAGLADPRCHSFESLNFPGSYPRHHESQVFIASGGDTGSNRPQTPTADSSRNLAAPWAPWWRPRGGRRRATTEVHPSRSIALLARSTDSGDAPRPGFSVASAWFSSANGRTRRS